MTMSLDLEALGATPHADGDADPRHGFHHTWVVDRDALHGVTRRFVDAGYFLEMVTCQDRREDLRCMRLVYTFNRFDVADRHRLHLDVPPGETAPSIAPLVAAADWHEREVFDMFGVRFDGHPNLVRLLLPEDADFHALLKDFGRMEDVE